jgi:hypothetical protein
MRLSHLTVVGASALFVNAVHDSAKAAEEPCNPKCNPPDTYCVGRPPAVAWHCEHNFPELFKQFKSIDLFLNGAVIQVNPKKD